MFHQIRFYDTGDMDTHASGEETALFGAGFAERPSLLDSTKQNGKKKKQL